MRQDERPEYILKYPSNIQVSDSRTIAKVVEFIPPSWIYVIAQLFTKNT